MLTQSTQSDAFKSLGNGSSRWQASRWFAWLCFCLFIFLSTTHFSLKILRKGKIKYELEQKPIALLGYNQPRASLAFTTEPVGNGGFEHGEWASLSLDVDIEVTMALRQAGRGHPQLLIHGPLGGIVEKAGI